MSRDQLLEIAAALFKERGYLGVTLDDIAQRLDRKKASLYYYISGKEDLIMEIYEKAREVTEEEFLPILDSSFSPDEKLRRLIHKYVEIATTNVYFQAAAMRNANELSEERSQTVLRMYREFEKKFEEIIIQGQEQDIIRPIPSRLLTLALIGMCSAICNWHRYTNFTADEIGNHFTSILEAGWLASGKVSKNAWPRADTVDQAFEPAHTSLSELKEAVRILENEIVRAHERLHDGLAEEK